MTSANLAIGSVVLDYDLVLERRKTIAITVYPDQTVRVKAPIQATRKHIDEMLTRRAHWILKQKRYFAQYKPRKPKQYVSGETFRYLGRSYKLLVRRAIDEERVVLHKGEIVVYTSMFGNWLNTKRLLYCWFAERASIIFPEILAECLGSFDLDQAPVLAIRSMRRRWGSYSSQTHRITLNLDLIRATKQQIRYVLIHELCHTHSYRHDAKFYLRLNEILPGWKTTKEQLEKALLGQ